MATVRIQCPCCGDHFRISLNRLHPSDTEKRRQSARTLNRWRRRHHSATAHPVPDGVPPPIPKEKPHVRTR